MTITHIISAKIMSASEEKKPINTKVINAVIEIDTGQTNYSICEMIEQTLLNSSLNIQEFNLKVQEVKVIDSHEKRAN